jgi:hypothetical protein
VPELEPFVQLTMSLTTEASKIEQWRVKVRSYKFELGCDCDAACRQAVGRSRTRRSAEREHHGMRKGDSVVAPCYKFEAELALRIYRAPAATNTRCQDRYSRQTESRGPR